MNQLELKANIGKSEEIASGPRTKMLVVYVGSGEDLISQLCEHVNKVSKPFGFQFGLYHVVVALSVIRRISLAYFLGSWPQARENTREQVTIGFDFTSDWLKKRCEFFFLANHKAQQ